MSKKEKKYGVPVARNGVGRPKEVNFSFKRLRKITNQLIVSEVKKQIDNPEYVPLNREQLDDMARKFL
jgi:hypothetical protein